MSAVFPTYPEGMIRPVKGKGCWVWDEKGNSYLDFTSGIGVNLLGHVPEEVKKKVIEQLDQIWHTSNLFTISPQMELAKKLTEISGLDYVFFGNSGAEANEAAIKLARRYQQKVKNRQRYQIITFQQSFHGRTLATLTATGQMKVKDGFDPLPYGFVTIPYGDIEAFDKAVTHETAAVMLEVIQGEGGIYQADSIWLSHLEQVAKEHDILLMVDEVQTGMGRTGEWFGFQNYPIKPDVITLAKGLGSGFPIGAMLGSKKTKEAFSLGSHGSTFGGNFIVTTAALATIETLQKKEILSHVKEIGDDLKEQLQQKLKKYPDYVEVRGKGLMIGIEWKKPVAPLVGLAKEQGLLVLTAGPNVLRLLPPLNISKEEVAQGIDRLISSIEAWQK